MRVRILTLFFMDNLVKITSEAYNSYLEFYNYNIKKIKPLAKKYSGLLPLIGNEKVGYIVIQKEPFVIHALLTEPLKIQVQSTVQALYFYDFLIARTRYLFRIILNNIFLHAHDYKISIKEPYYFFMINLLKTNKSAIVIQDNLLSNTLVSIKKYEDTYYFDSKNILLNQNNDINNYNSLKKNDYVLDKQDILNLITYLYPVDHHNFNDLLLKNNRLFWLYLFIFYVSFKESVPFYEIVDDEVMNLEENTSELISYFEKKNSDDTKHNFISKKIQKFTKRHNIVLSNLTYKIHNHYTHVQAKSVNKF